jgi:hypothetical protein
MAAGPCHAFDRVSMASTAVTKIIHHIRICTDIEINADVKPEGLFLQKASI